MTQRKNTKRALLASVLSIVLCAAMLVGLTFAWFTDGVSTESNKIVAGNLDVALYNVDGSTETEVTENTNLFDSGSLWEPGHVEVVNLKIANLGSLALTYQFAINVASEKGSVNVYGNEFKLSDYIKFAVIEGNQSYESRDAAITAAEEAGTVNISGLSFSDGDVLYPEGSADGISEKYVTLVVYMPTSVGNDANYMTADNVSAPEINLGVTLMATQTPYESDSFGIDYDAAAAVNTEEELRDAVAQGGDVVLYSDIELTDELDINTDTVLDLSGNTIVFSADTYGSNSSSSDSHNTPIQVNAGATLTITGNGTIDASSASDYVVPVNCNGGNLVIENGTITVDTPRESCVYVWNGGTVTIYDGLFINSSSEDYAYGDGAPLTLNMSNGNPGTITVYGGTFVGRDPDLGDDNLGGTFVAAGYQSTEVSAGRFVVTEQGTTPVGNAEDMTAAIKDPNTEIVLLENDIDVGGCVYVGDNSTTIDLGGNTLSNAFIIVETLSDEDLEVVIENGTISGDGVDTDNYYGLIDVYGYSQDQPAKVTVKDVVVDASANNGTPALKFYNSDVILDNVTVTGSVIHNDSDTLVINGGNYTGRASDKYVILSNFGATINGGTFTATGADQVIFQVTTTNPTVRDFTINGGIFNYDPASFPIYNAGGNSSSMFIKINGGTFNGVTYSPDMYDSLIQD
ncbi:MAG: hypothetical protein KHW62_03035 [Clostridiales bacterium]|nr:hypothetical protein [Clostridiales bacterium]